MSADNSFTAGRVARPPSARADGAAADVERRRFLRQVALAGLAVGLATASGASTAWADRRGGDPDRDDSVTDGFDQERVRFLLPRNRRFNPRRLLVLHDFGASIAALPRYASAQLDNKLPLGGAPLIGGLFKGGRANRFLRPELQIGVVRRDDDILVADIRARDLSRRAVSRLLARDALLLTKPPLENEAVSMRLRIAFSAVDPGTVSDAAASGPVIGGVYAAEEAMLLSPPRDEFFGPSLF